MKDKLAGALGTFGMVIWYILSFLYMFSPLVMLRFGWIINGILLAAMIFVPFVGEIVRMALYLWAIVDTASKPIDAISIIFFVIAALYVITTLVPFVSEIVSGASKRRNS